MPVDSFISYIRHELNRATLTAEAYERDVRQFIDWLTCYNPDRIELSDISTSDVRAWLASMAREEHFTTTTLRRKAQSLRAFFRFLLKRGFITSNPTLDLTLPKIPKQLPNFVRADEMEELLQRDDDEISVDPDDIARRQDSLIIELLYTLGLRRAELIAISDNDITPSTGEIKITGKRAKQRVVPAPQLLLDKIKEWQHIRDNLWPTLSEPRPLFVVKGRRISTSQVYEAVKRELAGTSARVKSPHALRHSFATSMLNEGADLNSVKEFLGHSSLSTTQVYTHISFSEMKKAYSAAHPRSKAEKKDDNTP